MLYFEFRRQAGCNPVFVVVHPRRHHGVFHRQRRCAATTDEQLTVAADPARLHLA
ncbi:MAG: hypothetical protein U0835_16285 [Isosphaeraceae bacterium]